MVIGGFSQNTTLLITTLPSYSCHAGCHGYWRDVIGISSFELPSLFPSLPPLQDQAAKEKAMAGLSTMSSAQIVSASSLQNAGAHRMFGTPGIAGNAVPMHTMLSPSK